MSDAIILFAHGSKDILWRKPVEAVANRIQALTPDTHVRCAYLEWTEPTLAGAMSDLAKLGTKNVRVLPLFLGIGKHLREDLPMLVDQLTTEFPHIKVTVLPSVGEDPNVIDMLARLAIGNEFIDH